MSSTDSAVIRGIWKSSIRVLTSSGVERPGGGDSGGAWAPGMGKTDYFEYSSTMSCSCTGAAISRRSGLRSTFAVSESWSACSHGGT